MGGDRGILVKTDQMVEPLAVAKILKAIVDAEQPGFVITGKQAIDDDANQVGQMLAALLGWPQGTFAHSLELGDGSAKITREIDGGLQTVEVKLPAVMTTDLRLNEPRYASLPNIMKAKKKPIDGKVRRRPGRGHHPALQGAESFRAAQARRRRESRRRGRASGQAQSRRSASDGLAGHRRT